MRLNTYIGNEMVRSVGGVPENGFPESIAILLQNPTFVELNEFGYVPAYGSIYKDNNFISNEPNVHDVLDESKVYFAGIVENIMVKHYVTSKEDEMMIAILSSSPTFKLEDDSVGMYQKL